MSAQLPPRCSGVVLHYTALPGPHGSGDLGPEAHRFADWLAAAGQTLWQALPITPAGPGDSPYQSPSAFAGHPQLIALQPLVEAGWLGASALADAPAAGFNDRRVDFGRVIPWRRARLDAAAAAFAERATPAQREAFAAWRAAQADWLDEWSLFAALKRHHGEQAWWTWPEDVRQREPDALAAARRTLAAAIDAQAWWQWQFEQQLQALKAHANARGVQLMGDMPIFVAHDSADVWSRRELFRLGPDGQPTVVAGVPPDGYTPDGQRWGNPLYAWDRHAAEGYAWWTARVKRGLAGADVFRIDHFRGFAGYFEIPADHPTARHGTWQPGPGAPLFDAITAALGRLPIVAEDLGTITPDVTALLQHCGYPGMRIVYEGLMHGPQHGFLPQHFVPEMLAYTSTHDSDTVAGWWATASAEQRAFVSAYLRIPANADAATMVRATLHATLTSPARLALAPLQDLLALGSEARMNRPGTGEGNWSWRFTWGDLPTALAGELAALVAVSDRRPHGTPGPGPG